MHELKILTGYVLKKLEKEFKEYMDEVEERLGEGINVSTWFELAEHKENDFPLPLIHIFINVEQYMTKEEWDEHERKNKEYLNKK